MPAAPSPDLETLRRRVADALPGDRAQLTARLRGLERAARAGKPLGRALDAVASAIEQSARTREAREESRPKDLRYPPDLPVVEKRGEILDAVRDHQVVVVCGETGSGKTTQLPKVCIELGRGVDGLIGHTQPRRIAARSVAQRIAEELGTRLGETVGYKVRFGDQTSGRTLVKVMTDGILLAETQGDRDLRAYDTIIIDEAHERSLNIDFLLGYLAQLLPRRPDLKLIITSATIDPERFSRHFGDCPIVNVSGRTYPVEVRYRTPRLPVHDDADDLLGEPAQPLGELEMQEDILRAVEEVTREGPGDVLVFLSGEREIRETAETLRERFVPRFPQTEILPLYARLSAAEQQRVFQPHAGRRVVLATNVAETSLTVPGIVYVIDPGFARISRYSPKSRIQRLPVEPISQASASQRAGRCGRVAPGVCIRLYPEEDFLAREEFTEPELRRTDLASVVLQMKALKLGDPLEFPFVEPPEARFVREGVETLRELGALDEKNDLTDIGAKIARLPVHPRIGRMLLAGDEMGCLHETLVIAAAMSVQDPRERPRDQQGEADAKHERFRSETSDFQSLLNLWQFWREMSEKLSSSKLRKACRENFLSFVRLREWQDTHRQLRDLAKELGLREQTRAQFDEEALTTALLTGLLSNIGRKQETGYEYAGAGGSRFSIHPGSGLFKAKPKWLVAGELVRTTKLYARTAARVQPEWIERAAGDRVQRAHTDPWYDAERAQVFALERGSLFGLTLYERRRVNYAKVDPKAARDLFIHHALVEGELRTRAPWRKHNEQIIAQAKTLEAKLRKPELLETSAALHAFFDARLPPDIASGKRFESWRRHAEKANPRALHLALEDVLAQSPGDLRGLYPDALVLGETEIPLRYAFRPREEDDGVTASIPIAILHGLRPEPFEWLVPGWLEEKIAAMLRAAPKAVRQRLGPAPEAASTLRSSLRFGQGSLREALAAALRDRTGQQVSADAFPPRELPDHLRMRFEVIADDGRVLAEGRDLDALQLRLRSEARQSLRATAAPGASSGPMTTWEAGEIPRAVEVDRAGSKVLAYPALVDEWQGAALRLFESQEAADEAHCAGLRRLLAIACKREFRLRAQDMPGFDQMARLYAPLGDASRLFDQVLLRIAQSMFLDPIDPAQVRDERAFESLLDHSWERLSEAIAQTTGVALDTLRARQSCAIAIDDAKRWARPETVAEVEAQLAAIVPPAFLTETPAMWLRRLAVYCKAIERRLEKLRRDGAAKDAQRAADAALFWKAYLLRKGQHADRGIVDPELTRLRWMVEEFRVSLFAQDLGTIVPVSVKRLDEQFRKVRAPG